MEKVPPYAPQDSPRYTPHHAHPPRCLLLLLFITCMPGDVSKRPSLRTHRVARGLVLSVFITRTPRDERCTRP
jgi:hypothetical protein